MKQLWAPWRMTYIRGETEAPATGCIFCLSSRQDEDRQKLVLLRGEGAFVIMNKFPYTNGHLMVAPVRHSCDPGELSPAEVLEMNRLLVLSRDVLRETCAPHGFNIGMNLGQIAGAGVADHMHMHIVPRWSGDTNFMPVFADVRIIPQHLEETYEQLRQAFARRCP